MAHFCKQTFAKVSEITWRVTPEMTIDMLNRYGAQSVQYAEFMLSFSTREERAALGLDEQTIAARHPQLIHVSVLPFGASGEKAFGEKTGIVGVKIGDRETRDIVDIWALMPDEFNALAYCDPKAGERDYKNLPDAESLAAARTAVAPHAASCVIVSSRPETMSAAVRAKPSDGDCATMRWMTSICSRVSLTAVPFWRVLAGTKAAQN